MELKKTESGSVRPSLVSIYAMAQFGQNLLFCAWGMRKKEYVKPGLWYRAWVVRQVLGRCWKTNIIQQGVLTG